MEDNNNHNNHSDISKHNKSQHDKEVEEDWNKIQNQLKQNHITIDQVDWIIPKPTSAAVDGNSNKTTITTTTNSNETNTNNKEGLKYVGGVDISFIKDNLEDACASLIILEYPSLKVVHEEMKMVKLTLPYIPGYLAFRECPSLLNLLDNIRQQHSDIMPQVLFVDGNGMLHPRGFGLACQLGVEGNIPTIGVGKTFFHVDGLETKQVKDSFKENCKVAGDYILLKGDSGTVWGAAVLSHAKASNPVFISIGHRLSLESTLSIVKACTGDARVPEPVRQADLRSREFIRQYLKQNPQ